MVLVEALARPRKRLVLTLENERNFFAWCSITMMTIVTCLLMEKDFHIKTNNKNINFPTHFCLRCISNGFYVTDSGTVSL